MTIVQAPVTTAAIHYKRPAGDYADWGLHLFGDAIADGAAHVVGRRRASGPAWTRRGASSRSRSRTTRKPVNFIMHRPSGDTVPDPRARRRPLLRPLDHPEIWLEQGDPTVYSAPQLLAAPAGAPPVPAGGASA